MSTHALVRLATKILTGAALIAAAATVTAIALGATNTRNVHLRAQLKVTARTQSCRSGACTVHVTGDGHMTPYGTVTFTSRIISDSNQPPCPSGSWVRIVRDLHLGKGTLVLNEAGIQCVGPGGPRVDAVWVVDGARSRGLFAGAHGRGSDLVFLKDNTTAPSGTIVLAH